MKSDNSNSEDQGSPFDPETPEALLTWFDEVLPGVRMANRQNQLNGHVEARAAEATTAARAREFAFRLARESVGAPPLPPIVEDPRRDIIALHEWVLHRERAAETYALASAHKAATSPNGDTPPLTADHEAILTVLARNRTKCITVIAVASAGTIRNRETVGRLLKELAGFGLVNRPHGVRKGYALTSAGRTRANEATTAT